MLPCPRRRAAAAAVPLYEQYEHLHQQLAEQARLSSALAQQLAELQGRAGSRSSSSATAGAGAAATETALQLPLQPPPPQDFGGLMAVGASAMPAATWVAPAPGASNSAHGGAAGAVASGPGGPQAHMPYEQQRTQLPQQRPAVPAGGTPTYQLAPAPAAQQQAQALSGPVSGLHVGRLELPAAITLSDAQALAPGQLPPLGVHGGGVPAASAEAFAASAAAAAAPPSPRAQGLAAQLQAHAEQDGALQLQLNALDQQLLAQAAAAAAGAQRALLAAAADQGASMMMPTDSYLPAVASVSN